MGTRKLQQVLARFLNVNYESSSKMKLS